MSLPNQIKNTRKAAAQNGAAKSITSGFVVDTDDPQQNGRVRVCCPAMGDDPNPTSMNVDNIPWARMGVPLAGTMSQGYRGVDGKVEGETGYGFSGVPKVGTDVVVAIMDENPGMRVVIACLQHQSGGTAMPHGRFQSSGSFPDGPLALDGSHIQPMYDNYTQMFSGPYASGRQSFEWMSRGVDYTAGGYRGEAKNERQSDDDSENVTITEPDGRTIQYTQGYGADRVGDQPSVATNSSRKYDPQVYAWTTPGFHSISMDDRVENCRMRLRTTTGHQIVLDDTNERIYISTFKGKNWIEMDAAGNIDMHSDTRINIHAAKDINLTSEQTLRFTSNDIHFRAKNEIRMFSYGDTHVISNGNIRTASVQSTMMESKVGFSVLATSDAKITSEAGIQLLATSDVKATGANVHVLASSSAYVTGSSSVELMSGGNILGTGAQCLWNSGPAAASADSATAAAPAGAKTAYHTNRIPMHEPWPRVLVDLDKANNDADMSAIPVMYTNGTLSDFEFTDYNNSNIGRMEYGVSLKRNPKWHR